jgi:hypothetical protein
MIKQRARLDTTTSISRAGCMLFRSFNLNFVIDVRPRYRDCMLLAGISKNPGLPRGAAAT